MIKESWFYRFLKWLGIIKPYEVNKDEMCRRAISSGVCPNDCSSCAWKVVYVDE